MTIAELEEWLDDLGATVQITRRKIQRPRWVARVFFPGAERPMARAGRKGHGGGECTRRVMTRDDIEQLLAAVLAFHRMLRA